MMTTAFTSGTDRVCVAVRVALAVALGVCVGVIGAPCHTTSVIHAS